MAWLRRNTMNRDGLFIGTKCILYDLEGLPSTNSIILYSPSWKENWLTGSYVLTVQAYACTTHKCNAQKNAVMLAALYQMVYLNNRKCTWSIGSVLDELGSILLKLSTLMTPDQHPFRLSSQATLNLFLFYYFPSFRRWHRLWTLLSLRTPRRWYSARMLGLVEFSEQQSV